MEIKGTLKLTPVEKHLKVNQSDDGTKKKVDFCVPMTRKQAAKHFGERFAEAVFAGERVHEEEIEYDVTVKPDKQKFKMGDHDVKFEGMPKAFTAKPTLRKEVKGVDGADRVIIPLRLTFENREASFFLEDNMGNDKLSASFKSVAEEDTQTTISDAAKKNGQMGFDAATDTAIQ